MDLSRTTEKLFFEDLNAAQVRTIGMRNAISASLTREATNRLFQDGSLFADLYVIDTMTNKGARITYMGGGTFAVKISSRTGEALLNDLIDQAPKQLLDKIVIID